MMFYVSFYRVCDVDLQLKYTRRCHAVTVSLFNGS
jgi:hypothetical protein